MYNIFCQRRTNVHAHCIIEEYCTFALCILIFTHHIIFGFRHRMVVVVASGGNKLLAGILEVHDKLTEVTGVVTLGMECCTCVRKFVTGVVLDPS